MTTKCVGLVVAPGTPSTIADSIKEDLPDILYERVSDECEWDIEIVVDPLTGYAETISELYRKTEEYDENSNWDYMICITDLPIYHNDHIIAVDVNNRTDVGLISTPVYGMPPFNKKMINSIVSVIKLVRGEYKGEEKENVFNRFFRTIRLKYGTNYLEETDTNHTVYYMNNNNRAVLRLMAGMAWANNPFNMMRSLSAVISIAFATGMFGMIFSTMWNLSNLFPIWRMTAISVLAVVGMIVWIIISHDLWEKVGNKKHKKVRKLYNGTTVFTLLMSFVFYFGTLYLLFLSASLVILPPDYIVQRIEPDEINIVFYLELAWFATALSTVAGAIGAGVQDNNLIRESTYGYRQRFRYERSNGK